MISYSHLVKYRILCLHQLLSRCILFYRSFSICNWSNSSRSLSYEERCLLLCIAAYLLPGHLFTSKAFSPYLLYSLIHRSIILYPHRILFLMHVRIYVNLDVYLQFPTFALCSISLDVDLFSFLHPYSKFITTKKVDTWWFPCVYL